MKLLLSVVGSALVGLAVLVAAAGSGVMWQRRLQSGDLAGSYETHSPASSAPPTATPFDGVPVVGALFRSSGGRLQEHFCTAGVVDSPQKDLLITAAHCTDDDGDIAFVPGYHDGEDPYGIWPVTRVVTDDDWESSSDPDHDVAFLQVGSVAGRAIEDVTGAARLGIGWPASGTVRVVGYPQDDDRPISCANQIKAHDARQLKFDCRGFKTGTSGSPLITQQNTIIGVIGGYQSGGDSPDVSYSATLGEDVRSLYATATASAG